MKNQKVYMRIPKNSTKAKAIRAKCLDCSENSVEVRECTAVHCPLWPYRFGANPQSSINRLKKYYDVKLLEE